MGPEGLNAEIKIGGKGWGKEEKSELREQWVLLGDGH